MDKVNNSIAPNSNIERRNDPSRTGVSVEGMAGIQGSKLSYSAEYGRTSNG